MTEEWRPVVQAPEHYEVSNFGRVRRTATGRILKHGLAAAGYPVVNLSVNNQQRMAYVHRLVALAFIGPEPTFDHQVDHIDGVRTHNHLSNLEWVPPPENQRRAYALGLIPNGIKAALTESDVRFLRSSEGRSLPRRELAARYGVDPKHIDAIRRGRGWKHVV